MFRKMPFILLLMMGVIAGLHPWLPLSLQSLLYGLSLSIKSIIVFLLPFIVFALLFKTAVGLSRGASKVIFVLFMAIICSNFLSTTVSYAAGKMAYHIDLSLSSPSEKDGLLPLYVFALPKWIGNDKAMFLALFFGLVLGRWRPSMAASFLRPMEKGVDYLLKGLLLMIPPFLAGFFIKMCHDGTIFSILQNYWTIFLLIMGFVFSYICLLYFLATRHQPISFSQSLKNMVPATLAGFGSMSSAAAMPLTLIGVEKNAKDPVLATSIIPATVSIHLIGDCFAIPIFAFAVMKSFGLAEPSLMQYFIFASYFVLMKFSVAAVPGGGILVMLPILETCLGFNSTMLSLITALYILFDPVITAANVLGNGGFAMGLSRILSRQAKASM